jgi:hypothetical protein
MLFIIFTDILPFISSFIINFIWLPITL